MSQASYTNLSVVYFSVFLYTNLVAEQKRDRVFLQVRQEVENMD